MVTKAQRKQYSGEVKARAVIEAIKGVRTVNEIASTYGAHPVQVTKWKKQALLELPSLFSRRREETAAAEEALKERLYHLSALPTGRQAAGRGDRPAESGAGLAQKKIWDVRLRRSGRSFSEVGKKKMGCECHPHQ